MPCGGIGNLVDAGEGEGVLRESLIEVLEIDANARIYPSLAPSPSLLANPDVLFL